MKKNSKIAILMAMGLALSFGVIQPGNAQSIDPETAKQMLKNCKARLDMCLDAASTMAEKKACYATYNACLDEINAGLRDGIAADVSVDK